MYNRCLVLVVVIFSLIAGGQIAAAAAAQTEDVSKPTVAVLFVNNAKSTYDDVVSQKMLNDINGLLAGKYNVVSGDKYIERLNQNGIADITTSERSDIADALKGEPVDYVLYVEVQPFNMNRKFALFNHGVGLTATVPVKIIDLANNRHFYNGKFTEQAADYVAFGGVGSKSVAMKALDKVIAKMNPVIMQSCR